MRFILSFLCLLFSVQLSAQADFYYGGCADEHSDVFLSKDGYRYLAGTSTSFDWGAGDIYIVKTDSSGNATWSKNIRFTTNFENVLGIIAIAPDRLMLLVTLWNNNPSVLLTIDTAGNFIRAKSYSGIFRTICGLGGNIFVSGYSVLFANGFVNLPVIMKLDTASNLVDARYFQITPNQSSSDVLNITNIVANSDSTLSCLSYYQGYSFGQVVGKFDFDLNPLWMKLAPSQVGVGSSDFMISTGDKGIIIGGYHSYHRLFLARFDSTGANLWTHRYSFPSSVSYIDKAPGGCMASNKHIYLPGHFQDTASSNNTFQYCVLALDTNGNIDFLKEYGATGSDYSYSGLDLVPEGSKILFFTADEGNVAGNLISPFAPQYDLGLSVLDLAGNSNLQVRTIPVTDSLLLNISMQAMTWTPFPYTVSTNSVTPISFANASSTFTAGDCIGVSVPSNELKMTKIFPNPNRGEFDIQLGNINQDAASVKIYSSIGTLLFTKEQQAAGVIHVDLSSVSPGIYFVELISGNEITRSKIEIIR